MLMVVVKTKDVFNFKFLNKLKKLHNELENTMPHLNDISSLINTRNTRGEEDVLIVEDLFENWPKNEDELAKIKEISVSNEMYENLLLNQELTLTIIFLAGSLAVNDYIKISIQKDLQTFVKLVILMMAVFLFVIFRRISAVLLPFFVVVLSLLITIGIMALSGTPITIPTQILPSFLLAVGIGATIHLLAMFFKHFNANSSKEKAIVYALGHSGLAISMTSLTTAAGLLSFSTVEIAPLLILKFFSPWCYGCSTKYTCFITFYLNGDSF